MHKRRTIEPAVLQRCSRLDTRTLSLRSLRLGWTIGWKGMENNRQTHIDKSAMASRNGIRKTETWAKRLNQGKGNNNVNKPNGVVFVAAAIDVDFTPSTSHSQRITNRITKARSIVTRWHEHKIWAKPEIFNGSTLNIIVFIPYSYCLLFYGLQAAEQRQQ